MSDWYSRQFGDRDSFAMAFSFGQDPHPIGVPDLDSTWGGFSLWVKGHCLTRSVSEDSGVSDEVRWNLAPILRWLIDTAVFMLNEEPFPHLPRSDRLRDACAWIDHAGQPPMTLTDAEEQKWYSDRSEWRVRHALRAAAQDVPLPNVVMRRLGDFIEVSWDNDSWRPSRRGLDFVEKRGTEILGASSVAATMVDALRTVTQDVVAHYADQDSLAALAERAIAVVLHKSDWRLLVERHTAELCQIHMPDLRRRLEEHVLKQPGLLVPHTPETLLLRQYRAITAADVQSLLQAAASPPPQLLAEDLKRFVRPVQASTTEPWLEGYEAALDFRESVGWGDNPAPNLADWLSSRNLEIRRLALPQGTALASVRTTDVRGIAALNTRATAGVRRDTALGAALGHILMDPSGAAVDGPWEHWPTAARARAFSVMLQLPKDGVRDALAGKSVDASEVTRLMTRFGTGAHATTYHLRNLGYIDDDGRVDILREIAA